jgi:hypothetical protein
LFVLGEGAVWRGDVADEESHDGYMNAWIQALRKVVQQSR